MMQPLPDYYFRLRDNGALVFRIDYQSRQRRVGMEPIASVNIRNGEVRAQGDRPLTGADRDAIAEWTQARKATLALREEDEAQRKVEMLNATAQWAQARATDAQLEQATEALLMAIHDLRTVLVRKAADRAGRPADDEGD